MKKIVVTLLMLSLIITPIFANPRPSNNNNTLYIVIGVVSVLTLGIGYMIYDIVTNHDKVEFVNEEVNLTINDNNSIDVDGVYRFSRTGESIKSFEIVYPFPDQKEFGEIEINSIMINNKEVEFHKFEPNLSDTFFT